MRSSKWKPLTDGDPKALARAFDPMVEKAKQVGATTASATGRDDDGNVRFIVSVAKVGRKWITFWHLGEDSGWMVRR